MSRPQQAGLLRAPVCLVTCETAADYYPVGG